MPQKRSTNQKKSSKNKVNLWPFWEALFIAIILLLTSILLLFINLNVSAKEEIETTPNIKTLEIAFWQEVVKNNPTYLEGYLKLFELTHNEAFIYEAKKINPVYFLLQK